MSISAELFGPDERSQFPTGILDVKLELLPQPKELLEEDIFQRQVRTSLRACRFSPLLLEALKRQSLIFLGKVNCRFYETVHGIPRLAYC